MEKFELQVRGNLPVIAEGRYNRFVLQVENLHAFEKRLIRERQIKQF